VQPDDKVTPENEDLFDEEAQQGNYSLDVDGNLLVLDGPCPCVKENQHHICEKCADPCAVTDSELIAHLVKKLNVYRKDVEDKIKESKIAARKQYLLEREQILGTNRKQGGAKPKKKMKADIQKNDA
jgi:hypothetical protein